jgi:two-component system chemotaxis response regulator CheY
MGNTTTRIMVCDDLYGMRRLVVAALWALGFRAFTEAEDGREAWRALSQAPEPFDLIICDLNMPNLNGLELLRKVRADARIGSTPFIMLTANSDKANVSAALSAGANGYLVKPFSVKALGDKVSALWVKPAGKD